jgi:hypothetical protein
VNPPEQVPLETNKTVVVMSTREKEWAASVAAKTIMATTSTLRNTM